MVSGLNSMDKEVQLHECKRCECARAFILSDGGWVRVRVYPNPNLTLVFDGGCSESMAKGAIARAW